MGSKHADSAGIYFGWYIVAATVALSMFYGGVLYYGFPIFLDAIVEEYQWPRGLAAIAFGILALEGGAMAPVYGWAISRYGPRNPMICGTIVGAAGFYLLSLTDSLAVFYLGFLMAGSGLGIWYFAPLATIASWFSDKRALAIGIALAGYGLSGILAPPLVSLIEVFGWRATLTGIAAVIPLIGIAVALLLNVSPKNSRSLPSGVIDDARLVERSPPSETKAKVEVTLRHALRSRDFWIISMVFTGAYIAMTTIIPHLVLYLGDVGISKDIAALSILAMTISGIVGRVGGGFLGDLYDKRYVIAGAITVLGVGMLGFTLVSESWHLICVVLIGPSFGALTPLLPALIADKFGGRSFALILGVSMIPSTLICFWTPAAAGWVADVFGSYLPAWIAVTAFTLAHAPLPLLLSEAEQIQSETSEAANP